MLKRILARGMPDLYARLRDFRWESEAWITEHWLQETHVEKEVEWDLSSLLRGLDKYAVDAGKGRILIQAVEGWPYHLLCEALFAARLRQRGHHVEFLLCERDVPFCNVHNSYRGTEQPCDYCMKKKATLVAKHFPAQGMGPVSDTCRTAQAEVATLSLEACRKYRWRDLPLAQWCEPTLMWFQCRAHIEEADLPLYRRLLQAGLVVADRFPEHLARVNPACVVIFNGDFLVERIAREICARQGIRYVAHEVGYLPDTLCIARDAAAAGMSVDDTYASVADQPLAPAEETNVKNFFAERHKGPIGIGGKIFWPSIESDAAQIRQDVGLDDRPMALAFSNVTWDTAALGREIVFPSLIDWLSETVRYFGNHPEWQLVIRCHPSEVRDKGRESRDRVEIALPEHVGELPGNVHLVTASSVLSSYTLMDMARCGLVYTSTAGLEMAAAGKPVIVVARTHYRSKGFTSDPENRKQYEAAIRQHMEKDTPLTQESMTKVHRYAHHFFFERMIPISPLHMIPGQGQSALVSKSRRRFAGGSYRGLEIACDTIARGTPPVFSQRSP